MSKKLKVFRKTNIFFLVFIMLISTLSLFTACNKGNGDSLSVTEIDKIAGKAIPLDYSTGINDKNVYDNSLFYSNDFSLFSASPDPSMFYHDGYYYMYSTSSGVPLVCHRSKDFANWEYMGIAYDFNSEYNKKETWANKFFWAPEAFAYEGKFYMYVTVSNPHFPGCYPEGLEEIAQETAANKLTDSTFASTYGIKTNEALVQTSLLVADKPEGPFKLWTGKRTVKNYYHGVLDQEQPEIEQEMTAQTAPFFNFADCPAAWEKNSYLFDKNINRIAFEASRGRKFIWDANIFSNLDASWFVDEITGKKYMVFTRSSDGNGSLHGIWIIEMENPWTPKYDTLTELTTPRKLELNGDYTYGDSTTEGTMDGGINEGPFAMSHKTILPDGTEVNKYYLTFSTGKKTNGNNWGYNIAIAVADSPLGPYRKLDAKYGNPIYMVSPEYGDLPSSSWTHGSGHGTFCTANGETFLVAHSTQSNKTTGTNCERMVIVDNLVWEYNEELGYDLPHMNGPSKETLQPQPATASGYKNVAPLAKVEATNVDAKSSVDYLNDNYRVIHEIDDSKLFKTNIGGTTIRFTFEEPQDVRAIMVYNSRDIQFAFSKIDYILLENDEETRIIRDIEYPKSGLTDETIDSAFIKPGGSAIAEFEQMKVNRISFKITEKFDIYKDEIIEGIDDEGISYGIAISDIVVLGKVDDKADSNTNFDESKFGGSTMIDLSNKDAETGENILLDRNLFDISGSHCNPINYICNPNGSVVLNGNQINVPFKNNSRASNNFVVTIDSLKYNNSTYSQSWFNGAVAVYTGSEGATNLQFRIFASVYNGNLAICFNHYGSPWSERYYLTNIPDYTKNGAQHTLTVAYEDGVYYIGFALPGKEMQYMRIDRYTPFETKDGKGSDASALFSFDDKVIGLATVDWGVEFKKVEYNCDNDYSKAQIAIIKAKLGNN